MARALQAVIATLSLDPEAYELRTGDPVGDVPRSPARDDVAWEIAAIHNSIGDGYGSATWTGTGPDRWTSRVALPQVGSGGYTVDPDFGDDRTARTPTLEAAGLRTWLAIELAYQELADPADSDADGATVRFRLWDGTIALWWSGIEWEAPATAADWNTAAEVQANFPELPGTIRALAVIARLGTSSSDVTPAFYGARVAFGVRQVSAWDNAVLRTVVASLRDELAELPGTWAAGTWTPEDPIPADHVVRVEFAYLPDVVARRHQDLENLARLPAIYLSTSGTPETLIRAQDVIEVRNTLADPPTVVVLPGPDLVTLTLQLRIVAELGSDTERIAQAVRTWLGPRAYRRLISPETGELVTVTQSTPAVETSDLLAQGVAEARATWLLTFHAPAAQFSATETLVRQDGITVTASDPTLA